jgi:hypothetical protein
MNKYLDIECGKIEGINEVSEINFLRELENKGHTLQYNLGAIEVYEGNDLEFTEEEKDRLTEFGYKVNFDSICGDIYYSKKV